MHMHLSFFYCLVEKKHKENNTGDTFHVQKKVSRNAARVCVSWKNVGGVGVVAARVKTHDVLFSEAPSRVVVAVAPDNMQLVENMAESMGVPITRLGLATGDQISFKGLLQGSLADATEQWRTKLPLAMGAL